jgi:UDPglucose 6-dehydrogenase
MVTNISTLSVIGLGKLGAPMVACFAERGFNVIGVDVNPAFVQAIDSGQAPVVEPGLDDMLARNRSRIRATLDYADAVTHSDATFVIVPTPSDETGCFTNKYVLASIEQIGAALRQKQTFHLVVITSTVMPGSTDGEIRAALEAASGKKCGEDFGICYSPEFIALGNVIHDMLNPDFVLVGESDPKAGAMLEQIYRQVVGDKPFAHMNLVNAELAKISVNTFVTTRISYANMLSEMCDQIPNADVDVVTNAIGMDSRIGKKYLRGATGYGGPCFPRDNIAFSRLAQSYGVSPTLAEATDSVNRRQSSRLVERLLSKISPDATVGILGLAYKPDTNVIEESQGVALAEELLSKGISVVLYDPLAKDNLQQRLGDKPIYAASAKDCVQKADAVVITIPSQEFKAIEPDDFATGNGHRKVVLDCWRMLDRAEFAAAIDYVALGSNPTQA